MRSIFGVGFTTLSEIVNSCEQFALAYDNICKYLAEEYPSEFFQWLLGKQPRDIQVLKSDAARSWGFPP
ncbi:MAG: hypothetical protein F6K02_29545 [Moorea sp. SIO3A5]|nr:hypothetical protein [Moorena sp. SIO3A5]